MSNVPTTLLPGKTESSPPTPLLPPEPIHTGVVDVPVRTLGRRSTALLVKTDFSPPTPLIRTTPQLPITNPCPTHLQPFCLGRRIRLAGFRRDSAKLKQAWLYARCSRISSPPTPPMPPRLVADESVFWSTLASDAYPPQPPITNPCPTYLHPSCLGRRNLPLLRL